MTNRFKSYDLAVELYRKVEQIPAKPSLRDQLLRASESVVLNLAEGRGRHTSKDQARFFAMALGSIREVRAVFDLIKITDPSILDLADHISACLYKLVYRRK